MTYSGFVVARWAYNSPPRRRSLLREAEAGVEGARDRVIRLVADQHVVAGGIGFQARDDLAQRGGAVAAPLLLVRDHQPEDPVAQAERWRTIGVVAVHREPDHDLGTICPCAGVDRLRDEGRHELRFGERVGVGRDARLPVLFHHVAQGDAHSVSAFPP